MMFFSDRLLLNCIICGYSAVLTREGEANVLCLNSVIFFFRHALIEGYNDDSLLLYSQFTYRISLKWCIYVAVLWRRPLWDSMPFRKKSDG
jgi:hypothetical protein